jgi:hypothetical protein
MFVSLKETKNTIFKDMLKNTNKGKKIFNPLVIDKLHEKYGVTKHFIRMSLNGDRQSQTSDRIKADYKIFCNQIAEVLKD